MATDNMARGMAANAIDESKQYTDDIIANLPKGVVYKGRVDYYNLLPSNPELGWAYTVSYKGTTGTIVDGAEYVCISTNPVEWESLGSNKPPEGWAKEDLSEEVRGSLDAAIKTKSLTDGTITMPEIIEILREVNENGEHVLFDTSTLSAQMYLCTIYIDDYENPTVYRVEDSVTGKFSIGQYDATKTLQDLLDEAVEDYVTITVTAQTLDGVTVTGQNVYLRNGADITAPVVKTEPYSGQPISFIVPKDFVYFINIDNNLAMHFNPNTATGVATTNKSIVITYSDVSNVRTFTDVKSAVEAGAGNALVGKVINDTWTAANGTRYDDPMVVVAVKQVEDADGVPHLAAIMQRQYATVDAIVFDSAEQVSATGFYENDLYYYVKDGDNFVLLVKGTDYQVGDEITGSVYKNAIRDTTGNMLRYGYNRYRDSAYRQYLNSLNGIGDWWESTHIGDAAPSQLNSVRGYMAGCSAELLATVKPIKISCYANSVTDDSVIDTMVDTFFLPSGTEMYGSVNVNEGEYWEFWKDATGLESPSSAANAGRIIRRVTDKTSAVYCRLRSAFRSNSNNAWNCNTDGNLNNNNANNANYCAPDCSWLFDIRLACRAGALKEQAQGVIILSPRAINNTFLMPMPYGVERSAIHKEEQPLKEKTLLISTHFTIQLIDVKRA